MTANAKFEISDEEIRRLARTAAMLSIDGVQRANSGHPGLPMGASLFATVLWSRHLRFSPSRPEWLGRDRFILSAGHGSMLLYSLLHLFGYAVTLDDLKSFRQWESKTPGHPEFGLTPGVEATTGPLGQGFANGVGMALSAKMLEDRYRTDIVSHRVFGLVSDGDLMEGISYEAASLAGHLGLGNLVYLYDDNKICLAGPTDVTFTESVPRRFESCGWDVHEVDGYNVAAIDVAISKATACTTKPSIICVRTVIGYGSPKKADSCDVHGSPLGEAELLATKKALEWPTEPDFYVPEDVSSLLTSLIKEREAQANAWEEQFSSWQRENPALATQLTGQLRRELAPAIADDLVKELSQTKPEATRNLSGKAIQVVARHVSGFIGGSADLEPSTKTTIKDGGEIQRSSFGGKNIRFGVREHAMGAITNGLAYTQAWVPFCSTFLVFSDYMRPTIRLAALSHLQSVFIFTHDSFWVGEDGPTHEPIEHVQSLRLIPNTHVFRPADGLEVAGAYMAALNRKNGPTVLVFTRQDVPALEREESFKQQDVAKGGYVVSGSENSELVLIATGSEVHVAQSAAKLLAATGKRARVVSLPAVEVFMSQPKPYRDAVIPPSAQKVALEAGVSWGWERVVGENGLIIGVDRFGASAPGNIIAENFGLTAAAVSERIGKWFRDE